MPAHAHQTFTREDSGYYEHFTPEATQIFKPEREELDYHDTAVYRERSMTPEPPKEAESPYHGGYASSSSSEEDVASITSEDYAHFTTSMDEVHASSPTGENDSETTRDESDGLQSRLMSYFYTRCIKCFRSFEDRDGLFAHIEESQHGVNLETLEPESYVRPSRIVRQRALANCEPLPPPSPPARPPTSWKRDVILKHAHLDPRTNCLMCGRNCRNRSNLYYHIYAKNHFVDPNTFEDESRG